MQHIQERSDFVKPVVVVVVTIGYCLGVVFEMNVFGEFFKFVVTHDISNCRKMKFLDQYIL